MGAWLLRLWLCMALAVSASPSPSFQTVSVSVRDTAPVQTLDALYQGYNIDSGSLYHNIDLGDAVLQQLVRNLAPAQLRIGGSASDSVWYVPDGAAGAGPTPDPLSPNYAPLSTSSASGFVPEVTVVSAESWREICGFAASTGTSLLWDVNAVDFRTAGGAWSPSNVSALLALTAAEKLSVAGWELGNEPDLWQKHFGLTVSGSQLAADLRQLLSSLSSAGLSTAVYGPSLATFNEATVQAYLQAWMASGGGQLGFTAHAYPLGPPTYPLNSSLTPTSANPSCSSSNYFNRTRVNNLSWYLGNFSAAVAQFGDPASTRFILEETASNSLGGCVGFSDRFISGFYFQNILGIVAEAGWQQINRQDLAGMSFTSSGSQYTLFGPPGWTNGTGLTPPHADYFTALLWRRLMGKVVLSSTLSGDSSSLFTAHVWCSAAGAPGAVTLAYTNAYEVPVSITLGGESGAYALTPRSEFFLSGDELTDYPIYLNAEQGASKAERDAARLRVNRDGSLPRGLVTPEGRLVSDATGLVVPALSYGYVVLHAAGVAVCPAAAAAPDTTKAFAVGSRLSGTVVAVGIVAAVTLALVARHLGVGMRDDAGAARGSLSRNNNNKQSYGTLL